MSSCAKAYTPFTWTRLAWDSEQFGFPAARLIASGGGDGALLAELLEECGAEGIRHLTARVDAGDLRTIHVLENAGFELIDGIQTFRLDVLSRGFEAHGYGVRLVQAGDRAQVLAIARTSYTHDRFHADSSLATEIADRVNEMWVDNCCRGTMADAVFVAGLAGRILGFVTCKIDGGVGAIGMVATLEAARRRGVARAITAGALDWFASKGARAVEVGTQLSNIAAARLYQGFGFRTVGVSLTFRRLIHAD